MLGKNEAINLVFYKWTKEKNVNLSQLFSITLKVDAIENITKKEKNVKGL